MADKTLGERSRNAQEKIIRRQQILDAAIVEFEVNGYEKTTMTAISLRSGLSRPLVNFYFNNKAGIYNELEKTALEKLYMAFKHAVNGHEKGIQQLEKLVAAYLQYYVDYKSYFFILGKSDDEIDENEIPLEQPSQDVMGLIVLALEKGLADDSIRHDFTNNMEAAISIWSAIYGCILIADSKARIIKNHWKTEPDAIIRGAQKIILSAFSA